MEVGKITIGGADSRGNDRIAGLLLAGRNERM